MTLTQSLKNQGYDLINGTVRNHKLLQLWLQKTFDEVELYQQSIHHAFVSDVPLSLIESPALQVNAVQKDQYSFNVGITLVEKLLSAIGFGSLEVASSLTVGKNLSISYDNAICSEVPIAEVEAFLHRADFKYPNSTLFNNLNRDNVLLITGIISAKKLLVEIDTELSANVKLLTDLNVAGKGSVTFLADKEHKLTMKADNGIAFPIAVKASRLLFDDNKLEHLKMISDNRNFF